MTQLATTQNIRIDTSEDALEIIYSALPGSIFTLDTLNPVFFHLFNGQLGEVIQKFVNYRFPIAIVLPKEHGFGERVVELAREHKRHNTVRFFEEIDQAAEWAKQFITT